MLRKVHISNIYAFFLFSCMVILPFLPSNSTIFFSIFFSCVMLFNTPILKLSFIKSSMLLILIFAIGIFSGLSSFSDNIFFYFRDASFFIHPLILLFIGHSIINKSFGIKKLLKLIVKAAVVNSVINYSSFFVNLLSSFQLDLNQRYEFNLLSGFAVIGFLIIYYSKTTSFHLFKARAEIMLLIFFSLVIILSFSRTNIGILLVLFSIPTLNKFLSFKKLFVLFVGIITLVIFGGSYLSVAIPDSEATNFLEKVSYSANEILVRNYDTAQEINIYWRSQEAFLGLTKYLEGNVFQLIFGQGFGSYVSASGIFQYKLQVIPYFHNGFITILLKSGAIGLLMFFAFLFSLVKLSFKSLKTDNKKSSYYKLMIQGVVIILIFQTLFIMGIYSPDVSVMLMVLIGAIIKERKTIIINYD